MSKTGGPQFRKKEEFIPGTYRSGPTGYVSQRVVEYKLNPRDRVTPSLSPGTYQIEKPKKIGRVRLWIFRNPLKFQFFVVGLGLSVFFSKPLYDIFIKGSKEGPRPKIDRGYRF